MPATLLSEDLQQVYRFVNERIGFAYAPDRMSDLERGFFTACRDLGLIDPASCMQALNDPTKASAVEEALVKNLTIGETYFFRDKKLFAYLRDQLLPDLIRTRRISGKYLRIWSAACSTGEEAYSLAILINYLLPDLIDWDVTILASDINPGSLYAAEIGVYSRWSFREESPVPIDRHVIPSVDGRFKISETIKRMVKFSRINLINDHYPSPLTGTMKMDLIFCRNVLMYFSSELAAGVVDRLNSSLVDKGWLIVSPQEISYAQHPGFIQVKRDSVFLFRKGIEEYQKNPAIFNHNPSTVNDEIVQDRISDLNNLDLSQQKTLPNNSIIVLPDLTKSSINSNPDSIVHHDELIQAVNITAANHHDPDIRIQEGRLAEAELLLQEEQNPTPKTLGTMEMLAKKYADRGDWDHALGWCDKILAMDPLFAGAYHLRAIIHQNRGDIPAAIQSLKQALYAEPDYIPAHLMLGSFLGAEGRESEAKRHYQIALDILSSMADDIPIDETDGMPAIRVREMVQMLLAVVSSR
ncbi:MAG TPA: CheR family methyltransferase [Methanospirillum sp.]|uniref:CheR family methyltransferase n=1 Tax=Methanospirillum sp. TaxID=45200 RepID=UPI002C8DD9BB|nr:CheR family methyltransferase [Methanospirillum sp.]HWQ63568.1 CheR family methyltransferase [Methanospirillum sp.]